jgi:hypothetical protein
VRNDVAMTTIANFGIWQQDLRNRPPLIPDGANSLQLDLVEGFTRELTMAKIGRFFVFGLAEDRLSWCLFRLSGVLALRFQAQFTDPAPAVTWTRKAAGELISSLSLPAPATIGFQKPPNRKVDLVVLGATKSLLATDSFQMPFIPLQAISYLEISNN